MRRYVVIAAVTLLLLLESQVVVAQYGSSGQLTVSDANPPAGGQVTVSATGFAPSSPVQITIGSSSSAPVLLATVIADATGAVSGTFTIPASASGQYTLSATGTDTASSVLVMSAGVAIVAAVATPTSGVLGTTGRPGSDALVIAIAGAGIVLMTGVLLVVVYRRRSIA